MEHAINPARFDLTTLRLFVAAVEAGSLTLGAEHMAISLPAASKRLAELEGHIGSILLLRNKKGVTPTAPGLTFLRYAISIVAGIEQLSVAMVDYHRGAGGHLRLWANTSAFTGFLPKSNACAHATIAPVRPRTARNLFPRTMKATPRTTYSAFLAMPPSSSPNTRDAPAARKAITLMPVATGPVRSFCRVEMAPSHGRPPAPEAKASAIVATNTALARAMRRAAAGGSLLKIGFIRSSFREG
ncbi:hypothetical protein THIX_90587 [Thiomonas sp. X19]|nr:hypothetical protein THIX_90587 [Thiomonas sp. X19]